jgi:hypothetical protein
MFFQQRPPRFERFAHHVITVKDQQVEDEEMEIGPRGAVVLQQAE